ncbi:MAG TPA: DUF5916 domain-containing protein [Vicinamibacterales bacterium]|nr:DUF5916 domain-containing protein [Vicinamibacterales bacterium]
MRSFRSLVRPALGAAALSFGLAVTALGAPRPAVVSAPPAREAADAPRRLRAVRTRGPIVLDGILSEPAWRRAPVARSFTQNNPDEGAPATQETDVRVVYDATSLYIGVFAHDSNPAGIITDSLQKDFDPTSTDLFEVLLDTFDDQRNGYLFAVNPGGGKWDAQMADDGRYVNSSWDGIWNVATRVTKEGWYAEIQIPFRTLRFSPATRQVWGINFLRRIRRKNEDTYWAPVPRIYDITRASLEGTLYGLRRVRPGNDVRVKPYLLTSGTETAPSPVAGIVHGGFDASVGLASGLTGEFTVNTDFSQVEADQQQINLTRFNLLFPEQRQFFLDNAGLFQFGPAWGLGSGSNAPADSVLFFSRRIGLSGENNATPVPILAGTRLTGHVGPYSIGALNIEQRQQGASPATNFTAVRLQRDVLADSDVGFLFLNTAGGGRVNTVAGADANFLFHQNLNVSGYLVRSFSSQALQPGAGKDWFGQVGYYYPTSGIDSTTTFTTIGSRFDDELGFVPLVGINEIEGRTGWHFRPALTYGWLREIFPHWHYTYITRPGLGFYSRYFDYHVPFTFQNSTSLEVGINTSRERLTRPFLINSRRRIIVPAGLYSYPNYFAKITTNPGAPLSVNAQYLTGPLYGGYEHSYTGGGTVRTGARFNTGLEWTRDVIALPGGAFTTDLITTSIDYNFSTRAFLNALIQYNTDTEQWSANIRFDLIYRPLSNLYLVYNDQRDAITGQLIGRQLVAKLTYLMAF